MAHPYPPPAFPMCPISWATLPLLPMLVTTCAGETTKLACPCPFCPPRLSNSHMIPFRHFLSALFSKPYQWFHWRVHWWPGWAFFPPAVFPFTPTCPHPQLIPCFINGWQCPGAQAIFSVCVWRGSNGSLQLQWANAHCKSNGSYIQGSLMLYWYHYYKKIHFHSKIAVVYQYF